MHIVCLDLEGVLVPEIWIEFSKATGLSELKITTRDEPDYDKLMKFRIEVLGQKRPETARYPESYRRYGSVAGCLRVYHRSACPDPGNNFI